MFSLRSDLHLDMYDELPVISPCDDILVLAGDIFPAMNHEKFVRILEKCAGNAIYVLFIPGNHEFYCDPRKGSVKSMSYLEESMIGGFRELGSSRFIYMNEASLFFAGINLCFLGATLWTDVPCQLWENAATFLNDYNNIYINDRDRILADDMVVVHNRHRKFLKESIVKCRNKNIVVITHHVPDLRLSPKRNYRDIGNDLSRFYYCTDMEKIYINRDVVAWCCGHDHFSRHKKLDVPGSPYFISNPLGYPYQYNTEFDQFSTYRV